MLQDLQESQFTPIQSSIAQSSFIQSQSSIEGQLNLNSFIVEKQYRQKIETVQQDSVEFKENSVVFVNFKKNKTIQDKKQSLIKLRRYIQNILEDLQLQDELLQNYNLVKLVRSVLHSKMNQQIRLQIYRIIQLLSMLKKTTTLFKLFFHKHIKIVQNTILQMLKAPQKVVNKLAIQIVGNLVPFDTQQLFGFVIDQMLIKQMYTIILEKKIKAKETLCLIIFQIVGDLYQSKIAPKSENIEAIFDFLIAELPRYQRYKTPIQNVYEAFAHFLIQESNYSIKVKKEKIQQLLDVGQHNILAFLIYSSWVISEQDLRLINITEALQYLKIVAEYEQYNSQLWRVPDILGTLLWEQLTYEQNCLVKKIIDIVIKKGLKGETQMCFYYQESLIGLFRILISGCHENFSEFIKKQHYYHIARWTIFMYEKGIKSNPCDLIEDRLIHAIQTLNVGAAKYKLPKLKLIVQREKQIRRKAAYQYKKNKERKESKQNKENFFMITYR